MSDFVIEHRKEIVARCGAKTAARTAQPETALARGIPLFLDELVGVLQANRPAATAMTSGAIHGAALLRRGFTIGQVVREYGDICQTITELAIEHRHPISNEEFQLFNLCLDDAIVGAVTEYGRQRELDVAADVRDRSTEDLEVLSYEVSNLVWSAVLAFDALKSGRVGLSGSTSAVVTRSLASLSSLVERSFAVMKLKGRGGVRKPISIGELIAAVELTARAEAVAHRIRIAVEVRDPSATVEVDLPIFAPILAQLVQNACDHTPAHGDVALRSSATDEWVRIEIEDECGGLLPGGATLFLPLATDRKERSGFGLTLALIQRGIEVHGGTIQVRDVPGAGCVFTVDLPRRPDMPQREFPSEASSMPRPTRPRPRLVSVEPFAGSGKLITPKT